MVYTLYKVSFLRLLLQYFKGVHDIYKDGSGYINMKRDVHVICSIQS